MVNQPVLKLHVHNKTWRIASIVHNVLDLQDTLDDFFIKHLFSLETFQLTTKHFLVKRGAISKRHDVFLSQELLWNLACD